MNNITYESSISQYLCTLVSRCFAENVPPSGRRVLFFEGLPLTLLQQALGSENVVDFPTFPLSQCLNDREALARMLNESDKPLLAACFEHYAALGGLNYDYEAVLVENNLFAPGETIAAANDLAELDEKYAANLPDAKLESALEFYADILPLGENLYKLCYHRRNAATLALFFAQNEAEMQPAKSKNALEIDCGGTEYDRLLIDALYTDKHFLDVLVKCKNDSEANRAAALQALLRETGRGEIRFALSAPFAAAESDKYDFSPFLEILKRHWGENAEFRPLRFYRDPLNTSETITRSQGEIIAAISDQAERALAAESCRNVFVTAPTGAGKSILFQLPALYLAEKCQAVTIVVTPLIALMKDQLDALEQNRNVTNATYINSTITAEQRQTRLDQIAAGEKSLIYLSPELLLSMPIENLIKDRKLGLFVIDEAHTVTSWGKDFRTDYWFLGSYLSGLRRRGFNAPVLCLTATAVLGGNEDVVGETIEALEIENPILYLGSVKRDNIVFDITKTAKKDAASKRALAVSFITECVQKGEKTLLYAPYTTQINELFEALAPEIRKSVGRYHGKMSADERTLSQSQFSDNTHIVMLATKAFGMGVDLSDIQNVYHYAPTGSLADYVQEIGRAGRGQKSAAAHADYFETDMLYAEALASVSSVKQYQLREVAGKLCSRIAEDKSRVLLVSPDAYGCLFGESDAENKLKNALLLIAADGRAKYGFPVLSVREQNALGTNYVCVPENSEAEFLRKYGEYAHGVRDYTRLLAQANSHASDVTVRNFGTVYRIDSERLWEACFRELTFPDFKRKLFDATLFRFVTGDTATARLSMRLTYSHSFEDICRMLKTDLAETASLFAELYKAGEEFTSEHFAMLLKKRVPALVGHTENAKAVLETFVREAAEMSSFARRGTSDKSKFVRKSRDKNGFSTKYKVTSTNYATISTLFDKHLASLAPNEGNSYRAYVPYVKGSGTSMQSRLLNLLQLFTLATYEVSGGRSDEVYVRVNAPEYLQEAAAPRAKNQSLAEIQAKRAESRLCMGRFMSCEKSSDERWELIERYFLGDDIWSGEDDNENTGEENGA